MNVCITALNSTNVTECPEEASFAVGATILSPVTMFLAGVLGNILALSRLYKRRTDTRTAKFYNFLIGLAWTDLLGILITTPSVLASYVNGLKWVGGEPHCRFHGFAMTCFGIATPFIICAMAVERFLALKCVFFYTSKCRSGLERACILVMWITVILFGLLPFYGFGDFEKQYPGTWCFLDFHSQRLTTKLYAYIYASTNMILIAVIILCNTYVVFTLFKTSIRRMNDKRRCPSIQSSGCLSTEQEGLVNGPQQNKRRSRSMEIQMSVLLCALTVVFSICWAPLMVQILKTLITGRSNYIMDLAAVRLASINQTLDPWLYILLRRSFFTRLCSTFKQINFKCFRISQLHRDSDNDKKCKNENNVNNDHHPNNHAVANDHNIQQPIENNHSRVVLNQPDVMQSAKNSNSNSSPLPDVTQTGYNTSEKSDSGYVCHFHFGKPEQAENEDGGIYVKIVYLRPESSFKSCATHPQRSCPTTKIKRIVLDKTRNTIRRPTDTRFNNSTRPMVSHCSPISRYSPVRWSDVTSNDTVLSQDYNLTFHSETIREVSKDGITHDRLRRTKSNTAP